MNLVGNRGAATGRKIFITGASGVVGQALLKRLPREDVICLTHRQPVGAPRVEAITGDIRQPMLGLSPRDFDRLSRRIGWIVHSAASTNFTASAPELNQINVNGTRNLLDLADRADASTVYVSTAFVQSVSGDRTDGGFNAYERSKQAAETLVRESGLPVSIVRPSIVIGDSRTGFTTGFQGFYHVLGLILGNRLPVLPALPDGRVDIIPQDFVAEAIANLLESDVRQGEFWLTSGRHAPVLEALITTAARTVAAYTGKPVLQPHLVPRGGAGDPYTSRKNRRNLPPATRSALMQLEAYGKYLSAETPLPSSFNDTALLSATLDANLLKTAFIRSVLYWAETTLGSSARTAPAGTARRSRTTPFLPDRDRAHVSL